jgi:predicted hydrolase (HD superfamily)
MAAYKAELEAASGGYLIREPMRLLEAEAWVVAKLGATPRADHSRFVGSLMRALAGHLAPAEAELWELTGLLHDLDFFVVDGDWAIHGRTTAAWLEGRLPIASLIAIAAHDHRSGVLSDATMSRALRLSDALSILDQLAGRAATTNALNAGEVLLEAVSDGKPYLAGMIIEEADTLGVELGRVAAILSQLPVQPRG